MERGNETGKKLRSQNISRRKKLELIGLNGNIILK